MTRCSADDGHGDHSHRRADGRARIEIRDVEGLGSRLVRTSRMPVRTIRINFCARRSKQCNHSKVRHRPSTRFGSSLRNRRRQGLSPVFLESAERQCRNSNGLHQELFTDQSQWTAMSHRHNETSNDRVEPRISSRIYNFAAERLLLELSDSSRGRTHFSCQRCRGKEGMSQV